MFSQLWKNGSLRKVVRKAKLAGLPDSFDFKIKDIGVLVSAQHQKYVPMLVETIHQRMGINQNISILVYGETQEKCSLENLTYFNINSFSTTAVPKDPVVAAFIEKKFDMLLSYYLRDIPALEYVTLISNANLKIGVFKGKRSISHLEIKVKDLEPNGFITVVLDCLEGLRKPIVNK